MATALAELGASEFVGQESAQSLVTVGGVSAFLCHKLESCATSPQGQVVTVLVVDQAFRFLDSLGYPAANQVVVEASQDTGSALLGVAASPVGSGVWMYSFSTTQLGFSLVNIRADNNDVAVAPFLVEVVRRTCPQGQ